MNFRLLFAIVLMKMVSARYGGIRPKFFGLDSAVIVDTDKSLPVASQKGQQQKHNPQYFHRLHYPYYQIIPRTQQLPMTTEAPLSISSTSTTPAIIYTKDEFPADLLDIAQNKLGIKSLEEIPSISELGDLLGTQSAEETINYLRELTATEDGIELVKAYIESTDYTDSIGKGSSSTTSTVAAVPVDSTTTGDLVQPSFFKRMTEYWNFFDFFTPTVTTNIEDENNSLQQLGRFSTQDKHQQPVASHNMVSFKANSAHKPLLVRNPLPYHYPIPIRPLVIYQPRSAAAHAQHNPFYHLQSVVHLNTPKMLVPTIEMTSKPTDPSAKKATMSKQQQELQQQQQQQHQQLNDLAAKVSKFPLTHNRDALIDAQYVAAIEKAFAEDEDLKKILGSTETLK